jgi:hypothetical protein
MYIYRISIKASFVKLPWEKSEEYGRITLREPFSSESILPLFTLTIITDAEPQSSPFMFTVLKVLKNHIK